jgi:hypothetical protein
MIWIALATVVVLAVSWRLFSASHLPELARAKEDGDVQPLLAALGRLPARSQPDAFNRAIRELWDAYRRESAVPLVMELARLRSDSRIAQYWIEQVRTVEPELARAAFDPEFLEACYQPELAASCGPAG